MPFSAVFAYTPACLCTSPPPPLFTTRFSGTLQDMTLLPSLDWLDLSDNALSGPMPPLPPSVRWVDLSNNQLTGGVKLPTAPRHPDEGVALVLLNAANNRLSGEWSGLAHVGYGGDCLLSACY